MESDKQNRQTFDDFLAGHMDEQEKAAFLNRLEEDNELKAAFEAYKKISEGLEEAFLKEELVSIHQYAGRKKKTQFTWLAVAASITLIIGGYWLFQPLGTEDLYAKYFIADPGLPTVMGDVGSTYEFNDAMVDYKMKNYDTAIEKWKTLLEKHPESDTLNYYLGMAYLNKGQDQKSLSFLKKKSVAGSTVFKNGAQWYEALILIKKDEVQQAKQLLEKLPESEPVKALLKEIGKQP